MPGFSETFSWAQMPTALSPIARLMPVCLVLCLACSGARSADSGYATFDDPLPVQPWQPAQLVEVTEDLLRAAIARQQTDANRRRR
ncbi:hypothetical protein Thiosp_00872 [Thiorhodovibrio litoralis]|nr:hypothetical protein Thiosp_00872 [Thiorhodovibrio litoralis]